MKRVLIAVLAVAGVALLIGAAFAQMGGGQMGPGMMGPGMGWGQMGPGMMGPGMGWGPGMMGPGMMGPGGMGGGPCWYGYPGVTGPGQPGGAPQVPEEKAKELAQQYTDQYLKGFTVERILPFTGMGGMTMYSVELKGPKDEVRILHVNPWGNVMPFAGPWRR